jgi:hypothetical protein
MHLYDFKPRTQKTLQIGLSALAKLDDFRRARPFVFPTGTGEVTP